MANVCVNQVFVMHWRQLFDELCDFYILNYQCQYLGDYQYRYFVAHHLTFSNGTKLGNQESYCEKWIFR
jgi:hypothetical protein